MKQTCLSGHKKDFVGMLNSISLMFIFSPSAGSTVTIKGKEIPTKEKEVIKDDQS